MSQLSEVRQAKAIHRDTLLRRENVVGVGIGYRSSRSRESDELSVVVLVQRKLPAAALSSQAMVPKEVSGVRTDVVEVGTLMALGFMSPGVFTGQAPIRVGSPAPVEVIGSARTSRLRPAPAGVSIGHFKITAGTLGSVVCDRRTGQRLILSNNHVLANCNDARAGDPILQPGPIDRGLEGADTLASLVRFIPLRFNQEPATCSIAQTYAAIGNAMARLSHSSHQVQAVRSFPRAVNHVDAAVARPLDDDDIVESLLEVGQVYGQVEPELGQAVCKSGRTTGFTQGMVRVLDATVVVNYGADKAATFEGQVLTSPMSQGGDSGALIITAEARQTVGLLFAGSLQATIFTPIDKVLDALKIELPDAAGASGPARPGKTNGAKARPGSDPEAGLFSQAEAMNHARRVREAHETELLRKANVVGVGVGLCHSQGRGTEEVGLIVLVHHKVPAELLDWVDRIPSEIDGVPVEVREVGKIEAR